MANKKSKRQYLNYDSFKWSQREYSLKELLDSFSHRLPFLILVTQGHMGRDETIHCIGADEVYWLRKIAVQPRVVVKSLQDEYFSIPRNYKARINPLTLGGQRGSMCNIAQMLDNMPDYRMFEFRNAIDQEVYDGVGLGTTYRMGVLEVVDFYDERFLLVHPILQEDTRDPTILGRGPQTDLCKGPVYPLLTLIPVYMPIAVAIALAMAKGTERTFYKNMLDMSRCAKESSDDCSKKLEKLSDIMLFEGKPPKGDYEYIHFLKFIQGAVGDQPGLTYPRDHYRPPPIDDMDETPTSNRYSSCVQQPYDSTHKKNLTKVKMVLASKFRMIKKKKLPKRQQSFDIGRVPGINKNKAPTPPPSDDSSSSDDDDDDDYDTIPMEYFSKAHLLLEPLALRDRVGPVAIGIPAEPVLLEMHTILENDALPMPRLPEDIDGETGPVKPNLNSDTKSSIEKTFDPRTFADKRLPVLPERDFERKPKALPNVLPVKPRNAPRENKIPLPKPNEQSKQAWTTPTTKTMPQHQSPIKSSDSFKKTPHSKNLLPATWERPADQASMVPHDQYPTNTSSHTMQTSMPSPTLNVNTIGLTPFDQQTSPAHISDALKALKPIPKKKKVPTATLR